MRLWWPLRPRPGLGRRAEIEVCGYLRRKGFLLLASPFRGTRGEIDIVARDGDTLVFVEVKARRRAAHPEDAVTRSKQRKIMATAMEYRREDRRRASLPYRFDIVAVRVGDGSRSEYRHYTDAFRTERRRDGDGP